MRTVIQGKELTVTIKSDRELQTQEIIAAHQLATGNFEALFIKEDNKMPDTPNEIKEEIEQHNVPDWVQVEVTCPMCTHEGRVTTKFGNVFTKCPRCKIPLYNQYATGVKGEHDKAGNYYYAQEILRPRNGELTNDEQDLLNKMSRGEEK